jgi:hypothetical protein
VEALIDFSRYLSNTMSTRLYAVPLLKIVLKKTCDKSPNVFAFFGLPIAATNANPSITNAESPMRVTAAVQVIYFVRTSAKTDLFPDPNVWFVSTMGTGTGMSSCFRISCVLTRDQPHAR